MGKHVGIEASEFIISRPDLQAGLVDEIPEGEIPIRYINRYHAEEEMRCAFCHQHQAHNRGFTALMDDGRLALCGRNCGIKYFGEEAASKFEEELDQQIRRESKRKIVRRTLNGIPAVLDLLTDDLLDMEREALAACRALHYGFRYSGILSKLNEQGHYELKETKRRWIDQVDKEGRTKRVPIEEEKVVLRVRTASVMKTGESPTHQLEKARRLLEQLATKNAGEDLSDVIVERMGEYRSKAMSAIRNGVRFLDLCSQFFTKDNVKALSRLAERVQASVETVALHKRTDGFDLILEENTYYKREAYPVPDFAERPKVDDLISPLASI